MKFEEFLDLRARKQFSNGPLITMLDKARNDRHFPIATVTSHQGLSNDQLLDCLFKSLLALTIKIQSTALLALYKGNPPLTGGFPSQRARKIVSISWRHHVTIILCRPAVTVSSCMPNKYLHNISSVFSFDRSKHRRFQLFSNQDIPGPKPGFFFGNDRQVLKEVNIPIPASWRILKLQNYVLWNLQVIDK